ncbi:MAG: hypothetical protein HXX18_00970 [Bacteroidetes bacterium]|nr:hypothetical protein [Bacteroidota bacterium]
MEICQFWEIYLPILYGLMLFSIYYFLFLRKGKRFISFVKFPLALFTFVIGFVVYYIGHSEFEHAHKLITNVLLAFFSTCRLFVLGNDLVEMKDTVKSCPAFMIWFSIAASSAAIVFLSFLLNIFGKGILTFFKIKWNRSKENYIFFGVNEASVSLAEDMIKTKASRLIVFVKHIDVNENESLYDRAELTGALLKSRKSILDYLLVKNEESIIHPHIEDTTSAKKIFINSDYLSKLKLLKKLRLRTSHMFFLTENEDINIRSARSVINELNGLNLQEDITIHIRTLLEDVENLYFDSFTKTSPKIAIRFLNDSDIVARQLVNAHNPVDDNWIKKDVDKGIATSDFNIMLIGFGQTGISVLKRLVEFGQFVGSEFNAIIIDKAMNSKTGSFNNRYPGLISNYNFDFVETEVGKVEYYELIKKNLNELDYLIITLGNDALNVQAAFDIQQLARKISDRPLKILVRLNDSYAYDNLFQSTENISIEIFGREKDVFTEDIIIRASLEKTARKIHTYYNAQSDPLKRQSWDQLSRIKQLSNISVAEHIHTKLALAGLTIADVKQIGNKEQFILKIGEERLLNIAKGEHLRWNAHLFANGWVEYKLNEIPDKATSNKNEIKKLHACLVSWDQLSKVNKRFNEDYYKYDRENVTNIFELIKNGIYTE